MVKTTRLLLLLVPIALAADGRGEDQAPDAVRYGLQVRLAARSWEAGATQEARRLLSETDPRLRGWEYRHLAHRFGSEQPRIGLGVGVRHITFSPDGKLLAACSDDLRTRIWAWPRQRLVYNIHDETRSVSFSPDGQRLASGLSGTVRIREIKSEKTVHFWSGTPAVSGIPLRCAFHSSGKMVAAGSSNRGHVNLWKDGQRKPIVFDATGMQPLPVWNQDGSELLLVTHNFDPERNRVDHTLRWHDPANGKLNREQQLSGLERVNDMAVSCEGVTAIAAYRGAWKLQHGRLSRLITTSQQSVAAVAFSPDGKWLASAGDDETVCLWRTAGALTPALVLRGHQDAVTTVAFTPDGKVLASGSRDGRIRFWDLAECLPIETPGDRVGRRLSPGGRLLFSVRRGKHFELGDAAAEEAVVETPQNSHVLAASWDGKWLATRHSKDPRLDSWKFTLFPLDPREQPFRDELLHLPEAACFHPSGRWVAFAGRKKQDRGAPVTELALGAWEITPQHNSHTWSWHVKGDAYAVQAEYSADGRRLATGVIRQLRANQWDSVVAVWDQQGQRLVQWESRGLTDRLAIDRRGERVAIANARIEDADPKATVISIADVNTGRVQHRLKTRDSVVSLAFDRQGQRLAALFDNRGKPRLLKIWDTASGELMFREEMGLSSSLSFRDDDALVIAGEQAHVLRVKHRAPVSRPLR